MLGLFGKSSAREFRRLLPLISSINALEKDFEKLSAQELKDKTHDFRNRLQAGESLDDILPEAFAAVREAGKLTLRQRHFDVQLMGGIHLHRGGIVEMRTGEGKTLVATLPAYLNALEGCGVHVVTVNDYLSRRDGVWMGQIYHALGLSVGVINHETSFLYDPAHKELDQPRDELGSFKVFHEFLRPVNRRDAYAADITYGTNNEFGFDYLRDNIAYDKKELRQRGFHYAIVDEIDSILIDEARTPLIISAPTQESEGLYRTFAQIARSLAAGRDFTVDEKLRAVQLTEEGIERAEKMLGVANLYTEHGVKYVHHLETAVRAKALYQRDKEYVVRDGEVVIVDEFTGRLQPGRRWAEGLHQAIEAKEGVKLQQESRTFASITFQNYFRMYRKLSGMTGTAKTSAEEFYKVYGLEVLEIPTNKPSARVDKNDLIFQTEKGKFKALARRVKELHGKGQPVLIGTVSIEKNELLSAYLKAEGIPHELLNAKNHEREGEIIAQAGRRGAVTVATNMAGRGVDIKLGGNPAAEGEYEKVKMLKGLVVLGTERHEARRIDNQLRGRTGRQGDPGETQFYVSLEDTLMRVFAADTIKRMMGRFGIPEDEPIENSLITKSLESAQSKIEGFNFDARKHVLEFDDVLNHQRKTVYERRRRALLGEKADLDALIEGMAAGDAQTAALVEEKKKTLGEEEYYAALRRLILQTTDLFWVEHLEQMDYLRGSVNLRAYGQRDPLIEYRKEGLRLYREMEEAVADQILRLIGGIGAGAFVEKRGAVNLQEKHEGAPGLAATASGSSASSTKKIGRNELVTITNGKETQRLKYKRAEPLLAAGWRIASEQG